MFKQYINISENKKLVTVHFLFEHKDKEFASLQRRDPAKKLVSER